MNSLGTPDQAPLTVPLSKEFQMSSPVIPNELFKTYSNNSLTSNNNCEIHKFPYSILVTPINS